MNQIQAHKLPLVVEIFDFGNGSPSIGTLLFNGQNPTITPFYPMRIFNPKPDYQHLLNQSSASLKLATSPSKMSAPPHRSARTPCQGAVQGHCLATCDSTSPNPAGILFEVHPSLIKFGANEIREVIGVVGAVQLFKHDLITLP